MNAEQIECVDKMVYLGREFSFDPDCGSELKRRLKAGWSVFHQYKNFLTKRSVKMQSKRKIFNSCIIPAMTYAAETWALKKEHRHTLAVAQRRMERAMVGVSLMDRRTNEWLRGVTKVNDVRVEARGKKLGLKSLLEWKMRDGQRQSLSGRLLPSIGTQEQGSAGATSSSKSSEA